MSVFRPGLLEGVTIVCAGDSGAGIGDRLTDLGARLEALDGGLDDELMQAWARERAPVHAVVIDARNLLAPGLQDALTQVWAWIHALAGGVLVGAEGPSKVVLVAPAPEGGAGGGARAPEGGAHATAARAALENLARTLSVEWARYRITTVALLPDAHTPEDQLAELIAFLVSSAGHYFSGCRLELGSLTAWRDPS